MRYHLLFLFVLIVSACAPKSDPNAQIRQSVAATLAAIPTNTQNPIPTAYPSPTPFNLSGLFCEYQFCMGHPNDMAFFDVSAQNNPASPSTYSQGLVAAFNGNLFIQMIWQLAPGTADPQFMLDLVLDDGLDTRVGNLEVKLVRDMNVIYSPITTTATRPAVWRQQHGSVVNAFAWKIYTPQAENAQPLFEEALARFTCNK
jgi:hypothetical protein